MQALTQLGQRQRKATADVVRTPAHENEEAEIDIIKRFLPAQLSADEMQQAIATAVKETGAGSIKDMGQVMGYLKAHYAGQMDFSSASQDVKAALMAK